ncbi:MAG: hypothetical protein Q8R36_03495 [bacterium]|nr:hypothetical protein [bacterium]
MQLSNKQKFLSGTPDSGLPVGVSGESKNSTLLYGAALLLLSLAFAITSYGLLFGFILKKKDAITDSISKLNTEQLKEEQLKTLKESFRKTETERKKLSSYFINHEGIVGFIENIEQAGGQANVWLRFRFVNLRDDTLVVEFESIGSFNELFYFLELIEHVPLHLSFEKTLIQKDIPRGIEKRKESDTWYGVFTVTVVSFDPVRDKTISLFAVPRLAGLISSGVDNLK